MLATHLKTIYCRVFITEHCLKKVNNFYNCDTYKHVLIARSVFSRKQGKFIMAIDVYVTGQNLTQVYSRFPLPSNLIHE